MTITEQKIKVTLKMMEDFGMTQTSPADGLILAIPKGDTQEWKPLLLLEPEDFNAIEDYFLSKQKNE